MASLWRISGSMIDFAVIGGGIAGVSAAAKLASLGSVVLLEREDSLAFHATGRSSALYEPNYGNKTILAMTRAGLPAFEEPLGCDESVLSPRGVLMVATKDELAEHGGEVLEDWRELSPDEALDIVPILKRERLERAWHSGAAQDIDVDRLLQGFARTARERGVELRTKAEVTGLEATAKGWRVKTKTGDVEASVVVNAAGAWADTVAELAGLKPCGIQPFRRTMAVVAGPQDYAFETWPMTFSLHENWYAKPDAGQLYISPADEDPVAPMDAWPEDLAIATGIDRYMSMMNHEVTHVAHSWAGLRSFAPDRTPVVGMDPTAPGFFWLAGQGGYGIQTSPVMSAITAELNGGPESGMERWVLESLAPARFGNR